MTSELYPIPAGWHRVRGCNIEAGDRILAETGWERAENLGRGLHSYSAVGHPTAIYECVIRKTPTIKETP